MSRAVSFAVQSLVLATFIGACGGGGSSPTTPGTPNPPPSTGSFTLTVSSATLSLAPGATQTLVVSLTRAGGFTGAVSLTAAPLPAGATATFQPAQMAAGVTSSTLTIAVGASNTASATAITITGAATGLSNQSTAVQLTVAVPPPTTALFAIAPSVTSFLSPPSATLVHLPTIGITRNAGYTGAIAFTVSGLPPTVALGFSPASVTGNSTSMLIINAGAPNGTYTATIRAVGANSGGERTATVQVTVASPTSGNVTWRLCSTATKYPAWFVAVQDGNGPWTRVVPGDNGTSYSFNVSQSRGSVAWVSVDSGVARTTVYSYTQQEMLAAAASDCTLYQNVTTRTASGQVTGMTVSEQSLLGMGWWTGSASGGTTSSYSLLNLPSGPLDLIAVRASSDATFILNPNRVILRRALNPASGGSNALLDFNSSETFAPTLSTWTVGNTNGQAFSVSQYFTTAGQSTAQLTAMPGGDRTATARTVFGVPLAQTVSGDLHQVIFTIDVLAPRRASRQVITYARTIADRAIAFGPALPTPTISTVSTATAGFLRAQGTFPTEYESGVTLDVKSTGAFARFATVHATRGYLSTNGSYDIRMPDLTQVLGWDTNWTIRPGDPTDWWVSGGGPILELFDGRYIFTSTRRNWTGALTGIVAPVEGATYLMARATGTITP